jgi:hypothetical protein
VLYHIDPRRTASATSSYAPDLMEKVWTTARDAALGPRRAGPGRGKQLVMPSVSVSAGGTTRPYILARLDRDGHAELAAKVRTGEISANGL